MALAPDPADKGLDAVADGAFGGKHATVENRRAGYTAPLDMALSAARNGWTLAAGQGLLIVEHYEAALAVREAERRVVEAAVSYCQPPADDPWGYGDDARCDRLCDAVKDLVDATAVRSRREVTP